MSSSRAGAAKAHGLSWKPSKEAVNPAFLRALGRNPFGPTALDIRAAQAGWTGRPWREVRFEELAHRSLGDRCLTHQALDDALAQADPLRGLMAEMAQARPQGTPDAKDDPWFPAW